MRVDEKLREDLSKGEGETRFVVVAEDGVNCGSGDGFATGLLHGLPLHSPHSLDVGARLSCRRK